MLELLEDKIKALLKEEGVKLTWDVQNCLEDLVVECEEQLEYDEELAAGDWED